MPPMSRMQEVARWDDAPCSTDSCSTPKKPLVDPTTPIKNVRFSPSIDVREVPQLKDLPEAEAEATWYSPAEFENIKKTLVVTVRLMMAKKPLDQEQCSRGLEFRTPAGAKMRKKNKVKALTAVWNEQVAQWKQERTDEEAISFVYQKEVLECRDIALQMAMKDEKEASRYLRSDMDESESDIFLPLEESVKQSLDGPQRAAVMPTAA